MTQWVLDSGCMAAQPSGSESSKSKSVTTVDEVYLAEVVKAFKVKNSNLKI